MANVLVTGGAGYIGSHTTQELLAAGHHPLIFDNLSTGYRRLVVADLYEGDLGNSADLQKVFQTHRFDAVIHFASHCYVGESYQNPYKYYHDNILNALNLLGAMVTAGVPRIIFSSSCAVYGIPNVLPLPEEHATVPVNPYGHTKRCVEWMLEDFHQAHALEFVSLRYFNAAGADPQNRLGEMHEPETHLIPRVFMAASGKIERLEIYGRDYPTADGTCVRDYIHVTDLARAHVAALHRLLEGKPSGVFNLGTGRGYSVQQLLAAAEAVTGRVVPVTFAARRHGDPPELVADNRRALAELGWRPQFSDLPTILKTAWAWYQKL